MSNAYREEIQRHAPMSVGAQVAAIKHVQAGTDPNGVLAAELVKQFRPVVLRLAARLYNEEYVWEDFISAGDEGIMRGVMSYNPKRGVLPITYIWKCIRNELYRTMRGSRNGSLSIEDIPESSWFADHRADIEEDLIRQSRIDAIERALSVAPEPIRLVLEMRFGLGEFTSAATFDEIGRKLKFSREAARQRVANALSWMRKHLMGGSSSSAEDLDETQV